MGLKKPRAIYWLKIQTFKKYCNQQLNLFYLLRAAVCDFCRHASSAMRVPRFRKSKHRDAKESRNPYPRTLEPLIKGEPCLQPLGATWLGGSVCSGRGRYVLLAENSRSRCCPMKSGTPKTRNARCNFFLIKRLITPEYQVQCFNPSASQAGFFLFGRLFGHAAGVARSRRSDTTMHNEQMVLNTSRSAKTNSSISTGACLLRLVADVTV